MQNGNQLRIHGKMLQYDPRIPQVVVLRALCCLLCRDLPRLHVSGDQRALAQLQRGVQEEAHIQQLQHRSPQRLLRVVQRQVEPFDDQQLRRWLDRNLRRDRVSHGVVEPWDQEGGVVVVVR